MPDNVLTGKVLITAPGAEKVFDGLAKGVAKTDATLKKITPTSSAATQSLINLSRVAQDAPYGFIGIANNINPLLESFQRLRGSTRTTGEAIEAFADSLLGAGGLGLAVGVATSLLTVFSMRSQGAKKATEELNTETEAAKKKQDEFQSALNSTSSALIKDAKSLSDLKGILEATSAANVELTDSTIKRGLASFIFSQKESELQKVLSAEIEKQFILRKRLANVTSPFAGVQSFKVDEPALRQLKAQQKVNRELRVSDVELDRMIKRMEELNGVIGSSSSSVDLLNQMSQGFSNIFKNLTVGNVKIQPQKVDFDFSLFKDTIKPIPIALPADVIVSIRNVFLGGTNQKKTFAEQVQDYMNAEISKNVKPLTLNFSADYLAGQDNLKKIATAGMDLGNSFSDAMQAALYEGLVSIGQGIGNLLSGEDFGKQFANVFSGLFDMIGKALIKFGIAKSGIDKILGPGGILIPGGVAIGLGVFAIAAGQLLKNISGGRSGGGPVRAGESYLVGEFGPERFTPNVGGNIQSNSAISSGRSLQGAINVVVTGKFIQSGKDMIATLTLANQSNNRLV